MLITCVADSCPFPLAKTTITTHANIAKVFHDLPLDHLYVCATHRTLHLCRKKLVRRDCISDSNSKCFVSGRSVEADPDPEQDSLWRKTVISRVSRPKQEHAHAKQVLAEKYTRYKFGHCVKQFLVTRKVSICPIRLNSIMQRLYELFMQSKEQDENKVQMNDTMRLEKCDTRMDYILAVLDQELTHVNRYSNSCAGSVFRTQAAFLVSHDLMCEKNDLMPFSSCFDQPGFTSRYKRILGLD